MTTMLTILLMEEMKDLYLFFLLALFFYCQAWCDVWRQRWGVKRNLKFLCRCLVYLLWQVFDLRRRDRLKAQIKINLLNIHLATGKLCHCSQIFGRYPCICNQKNKLWENTNLGLSEDYVNIWGRAFEHIWTCNYKENILGLPNGDASHSVDLFQPELWHCLVMIITTWRKRD